MSTEPHDVDEPADGRPLVGPEDLVIPDDVESTITAGSPADTLQTSDDEDGTDGPQAG
jgi:hypothetical protein